MKYLIFLSLILTTNFSYANQRSLREALTSVQRIKSTIIDAARRFDIPPEYIAGAILSEHALNVNWEDRFQDRAIRNQWSRTLLTSSTNRALADYISSSKVDACRSLRTEYDFWYCAIKAHFGIRNSRLLPGIKYKKFTDTYFNPNGLGTTFGLGQLSPLRALMVTDMVAQRTSIPQIDFTSEVGRAQLYDDLLNPKRVVYYVAATLRKAIDVYRAHGFRIADDLGAVITLYNIGNEPRNAKRRKSNGGQPKPNKMGRWALENYDLIVDAIN